jgi:hypothetical protein
MEMDTQRETGQWLSDSKEVNASLFSELDVLLRSLDRFFTVENLTSPKDDLTSRNFFEELGTARDTILKVLAILEVVIPESRKNAYWFQNFAETKLLTAWKRDEFRESLYRQDTPEKGLSLLYDSFVNLKGIISDLMRTGSISYAVFMNIGHIISKDVRENVFFSPFVRDVNPEFDVIRSTAIADIVRSIGDRELRKNISLVFVSLFRFLRFLNVIDAAAPRSAYLNSSLAVLLMTGSEVPMFQGLAERAARECGEEGLAAVLHSLSYQFSIEGRRVFQVELRDIHRKKESAQFRGKIENCHGIMTKLVEQAIVQLARHFAPGISEEEIFPGYASRLQQSLRLREDLVALRMLIAKFEAVVGTSEYRGIFESLVNYMVYFESFTLRLLRYDEFEEFALFCSEIRAVKGSDFDRIAGMIGRFGIYVETTLRHVENRSELAKNPVDMKRIEGLLRQYI